MTEEGSPHGRLSPRDQEMMSITPQKPREALGNIEDSEARDRLMRAYHDSETTGGQE